MILLSAPALARPRDVVVLYDGLTVDALRNPRMSALRRLAKQGAVGLMNTAVAGARTDAAAMLAMSLGGLAPAEPTDEDAYQSDEQVERATAAVVYQRRTGLHGKGSAAVLHLGIASLRRRGIADALLVSVLERAGRSSAVAVCGNADSNLPGRRAALFAIDRSGVAECGLVARTCLAAAPNRPFGVRDDVDSLTRWASAVPTDLVIVHLGDGARAEAARARLSAAAYERARDSALTTLDACLEALGRLLPQDSARVLVLSPRPPAGSGGRWDRLTLAVLAGPGIGHGVLTSATTRTRALIANIDAAPTFLSWLGVAIPVSMGGHAFQILESGDSIGEAAALDRRSTVSDHAMTPVFVFLGVAVFLCGFGGLAAFLLGAKQTRAFAYCALALMNMPLAMMLAAPIPVRSVVELGTAVVLLMALCTAIEVAAASRLHLERLLVLTAATSLAIVIDGLAGQPLIKFSLLSAYQIQGIRFHGIGNEYMGVLIGSALLAVFLWRAKPPASAAAFAACALVLSLPWFGDKAGGSIVSAVAFGTAYAVLRGRRANWKLAIMWTLAGLAAAFALAGLDRLVSAGSASHMGVALGAAGERGWEYLWDIARRKALMNLGIAAKPQTATAIVAAVLFVALAHRLLGVRVRELAREHSEWARGLPAAGWGALAAFVFNDSGIVAALFLAGTFLVAGLYYLLDGPSGGPPIMGAGPAQVLPAAAGSPAIPSRE